MARRAECRDPGRDRGNHIYARLEWAATSLAAALRSPSRRGVSGRARDTAARARVTGRRADPSLAVRPHGAAPAPHGGRPAPAVDGGSGGSTPRGLAPLVPRD